MADSGIYLMAVAAASLAIGLAVAFQGLKQKRLGERAHSWPVVNGEVERSEVMETVSRDVGVFFEAKVEYVYRVGDRDYTGDEIAIGGTVSTTNRDDAELLCRRYFPGAVVAVHYDPAAPGTCFLEHGGSGWALLCGGGAFFSLLGAGLLLRACS